MRCNGSYELWKCGEECRDIFEATLLAFTLRARGKSQNISTEFRTE